MGVEVRIAGGSMQMVPLMSKGCHSLILIPGILPPTPRPLSTAAHRDHQSLVDEVVPAHVLLYCAGTAIQEDIAMQVWQVPNRSCRRTHPQS